MDAELQREKWRIRKARQRIAHPERDRLRKAAERLAYPERYEATKARKKEQRATPEGREKERLKKAAWYRANPGKAAAISRQRKQANVAQFLWYTAKTRAKKKGVPFSITPADIVVPEYCPVLGIPLTLGSSRDRSPSLDRVIPTLGYVPENVQVISWRANRIKYNATLDELRQIVAWLETIQSGAGGGKAGERGRS